MSGCHQILTGACNPGDRSFSLGNIDSISFLAYASGCELVILSFNFQRVQIIPGDVQISCVHCSSESGKIAAAYQNKIKIFEPILSASPDHPNPLFNYRWREASTLECECRVNSLSWDPEGYRLLMGGTSLQMWKSVKTFSIDPGESQTHAKINWECMWKCKTATEVHFLSFSPDACLFATAGKFDRLVKIWYPVTRFSPSPDKLTFDYVYLAHPRAVTGFSWRQTSKYMPKAAVFNALITSCLDKICRLWTETVLPDDGFNINIIRDSQPNDSKFNRNHKHRIMKRLQHVKACFHIKRHRQRDFNSSGSPFHVPMSFGGTSGLSASAVDCSQNNILAYHGACIHFHLVGSINSETDIPLVPPLKNHNFRVFWLNNKEMFFTQQAEAIMQELCRQGLEREDSIENPDDERAHRSKALGVALSQDESGGDEGSSQHSLSSAASSGSLMDGNDSPSIDILDQRLAGLLRDWHKTPDILVSLHPIDGSFLVWSIEWLDEHMPGSFRQSQVSFSSCIPGAIPLADATSMSSPNLYLFPLEKLASNRAAMMTKHHNGTLNLWTLSFGDDSKFCQVLSVAHAKRASGHRFQVREMTCHPVLPLILTAASHEYLSEVIVENDNTTGPKQLSQSYCSELILWRVDPIGPLCKSGGVVEVARINSTEVEAFTHVAWVPSLLPSTTLFSNSGCFVASDGTNLRVYQAVLDASNLLAEISTAFRKRKASLNDSVVSLSSSSSMSSIHGAIEEASESNLFAVVSQQSTSRPGCILQLDRIDNQMQGEVSFIQVFRDDLDSITRGMLDYREAFHVVLIQNQHEVHVWRIEISTPIHVMEGQEFYGDGPVIGAESNPSSNHFQFDIPSHHAMGNNNNNTIDGTFSTSGNHEIAQALSSLGIGKTSGQAANKKSFLNISISKILEQTICSGLDVSFSACHGHFVCGTSYALISTTKDYVKLWKLQRKVPDSAFSENHENNSKMGLFEFREWNTLKELRDGELVSASAAYSGRIACLFKLRGSKNSLVGNNSSANDDTKNDNNKCAVTVFECESTGGTNWLLEDTIELSTQDEVDAVHLEWVPKHDAQFILALAVFDMICLFAHVSNEPSITFGAKALPSTTSCKSQFWLPLHAFKLSSADGLRPFPVRFGWIHAVCVVAMRNEMQVYSQWALENLTDVGNLFPASKSVTAKTTTEDKSSTSQETWSELSLLTGSVGLFQYTRHCYPVLPQYHPKQLMEMLNSGKVRWVKVILAHLVRSVTGSSAVLKRQNSNLHEDAENRLRSTSRSRALSVSYPGPTPPSPLEHRNSMLFDEFNLSYAEIRSIVPVPLWMLLQADQEGGNAPSEDKTKDYDDLFNVESVDEPIDESVFDDVTEDEDGVGGSNNSTRQRRRSASGDNQPFTYGPRQSRMLSRVLTHTQLPGLTSLDQMHLLALADTVASIGTRLDHHQDTKQMAVHDGTPDSLDDCGLRFLLVVKHYSYLLRCLPPAQRVSLQQQGIASSDTVWAFHSESQEDILNLIPAYQKGEASWPQLRELGVGWWLRNNQTLRVCVEKMAKYAYQKENDPMDAAIFYLAMKKKTLVWGLYRSKRDEKMASFFSNDFTQERWRKAALKNAYALLGKQRFEHAAAFFLLAGSLKDALEVCLRKLKDIQLALVVGRLYEGGDLEPTPPSVRQLLQSEVIDGSIKSDDDSTSGNQDPFLRSIALWMMKEYQQSLDTLMLHSSTSGYTRVFNFYVYLRTHPLLVRQNRAKGTLALSNAERNLYFQTAHAHYAAGCPTLAIHVLTQLPKIFQKPNSVPSSPSKSPLAKTDSRIESGMLDNFHDLTSNNDVLSLKAPVKEVTNSSLDFDWSAPATNLSRNQPDDELKLDWDDDAAYEDDEEEVETKGRINGEQSKENSLNPLDQRLNKNISKDESVLVEDVEEDLNDPHTMISVELKLASCLKLMSEELVTMVGQIEGTELRLHLYAWLERQVPTLKELCKYKSDDEDSPDEWGNDRSLTPRLEPQNSGLHDILLSEKLDLEWKMGVLSRRSRWLRANRHLLATLLAFARLHAHSLAPVHIELVFLLDELQREKSSGTGPSLVSPLPLLHSEFPLLSAVANPNKSAVSYIQNSARDILHTVAELIAVPVFSLKPEEACTQVQPLLPLSSTNPHVRPSTPMLEAGTGHKEGESDGSKDVNDNHELSKGVSEDNASENGDNQENPAIEDDDPEEEENRKKNRHKRHSEASAVMKEEEVSSTVCDWRLVLVLRDSGLALSSCLFQALSDSEGASSNDGTSTKDYGVQLLYTPRRRQWSSTGTDSQGEKVISTPDKWPGVAILRGMLSREEDGENPKLKYLLVECYAAIFTSLFVHSVAVCDVNVIFRMLSKKMDAQSFAMVFGGGSKRQIKITTLNQLHPQSQSSSSDKDGGDTSPSSVWTTLASLNKARMKFNMKLLGQQFNLSSPKTPTTPSLKEERPSFREKFVPPETQIYAYLMSAPRPRTDEADGKLVFVESDEEEDLEEDLEDEDEDDFWDTKGTPKPIVNENREDHPFSYSWRLMRLAIVKLAKVELQRVVAIAGIEMSELSHVSPYLDGVMRVLTVWQDRLYKELESVAPAPLNLLPNTSVEHLSGPPINKYRALLDPTNTPFAQRKATFGLRRLWNMLVREDSVQDYFVRFVFGKRRAEDTMSLWEMSLDARQRKDDKSNDEFDDDQSLPIGPVRIVHKEHESISAFCFNQSSPGLLAIATPKEIQELDVGVLLDMETWKFEDQFELDLLNLYKDPESVATSSYLIVQSPSDRSMVSHMEKPQKGSHSLILKHRVDGVRRMASHATLPLYLSGSQDGSVRLWEFSHAQPVSVPRPPGTFAKVTRIRFHGNKFGVSDSDGRLSLWQIGANPRPFYTVQCHSKQTSDFVFLGSSSLVASGGMSSESKNVALWDTLMPMKKAQIASFTCHEQGCVAVAYAEEHQCLISAGKKGAICIWDIRQRSLRHRFQGHESAIKCMALDPAEEFYVTGAADGDIKVWDFSGKTRALFQGEHSRSGFFKNIPGQGVTQLGVDSSRRIFSCGADGSVKIRALAERFD